MEKAIDRLRFKAFEFEKVNMKRPAWVELHPVLYRELECDLEARRRFNLAENPPILGMEVRINAAKDPDYMEVGAD